MLVAWPLGGSSPSIGEKTWKAGQGGASPEAFFFLLLRKAGISWDGTSFPFVSSNFLPLGAV